MRISSGRCGKVWNSFLPSGGDWPLFVILFEWGRSLRTLARPAGGGGLWNEMNKGGLVSAFIF